MIKKTLILLFTFISFSLSAQNFYVADTNGNIYFKSGYFNSSQVGNIINGGKYLLEDGLIITSDPAVITFRTNKSGAFNPILVPLSGKFLWDFGDGSEIVEGNSPNHTYTDGSEKTVNVYIGSASLFLTSINFSYLNIVGNLDLSNLRINGSFFAYLNSELTSVIFRESGNTSSDFRVYSCNLSELDVSSFTFSGVFTASLNPSLTSIIFSALGNTASTFSVYSCNLSELDVSSFTFSGVFNAYLNSELDTVIFSGSGNTSSDFRVYSCNLAELDVSSFTFSGVFNAYLNSELDTIIFSESGNTSSDFSVYSCNLSELDVSSFTLSGTFNAYLNSELDTIIFSESGNTSSDFRVYSCNLAELDVSSFTFSGVFTASYNYALIAISWGNITTGISIVSASNCALPVSEIDEVFTMQDGFFTDGGSTPPIKNLTVNVSGGTNSAPTDGSLNTNIQSLLTKFSNAGFVFSAVIN